MFCVSDLFTEMAEERYFCAIVDCSESCLDRLMVCYAFRIFAFCDANDLLRHYEALLLDHLEVADHIYSGFWSDQCKFVELFVFEEFVSDLDDSLLAIYLAGEIDAYGDLALYTLKIEDVQCLIYVFSGYMVQYGTILQCAYY